MMVGLSVVGMIPGVNRELLVLATGAGSLIQVINAAMGNQHRFDAMKDFFGNVGEGDRAGVWEEVPTEHPEFRKDNRRMLDKAAKKRKAEEMGS